MTCEAKLYLNANHRGIVIEYPDSPSCVIPYTSQREMFDELDSTFHPDMEDIIMYVSKRMTYYNIHHTGDAFDSEEGQVTYYERQGDVVNAFFTKRLLGMDFEYGIRLTDSQVKQVPEDRIQPWKAMMVEQEEPPAYVILPSMREGL